MRLISLLNRVLMTRRSARLLPAMLFVLPWQGAPTASSSDAVPPSRAARISFISGEVSFQASGATDWSQATLNYSVTNGDRLLADAGGRAELEVGSLAARLSEGTDLTVATLDDHFSQFGLSQGALRVTVLQMQPADSVEVDTPNGAITILTAGKYRVDVAGNDGGTIVRLDEGTAEVTGPGISQQLRAPGTVRLTGTDPIQLTNVVRAGPDAFDQFSADRDRRLGASTSVKYVSPDVPGVADLDQSGRWQQDAEYGPVWYPVGMPLGWVPYRFGHWVWVDPWGWTWIDDAPWGFAPFHYGRWFHGRAGWGWIPGPLGPRPYYAPALVTFVDGSGFSVGVGVQAWFPLGPREAFFPWYHHDDRYLRAVNATNLRGVDIETVIRVRDVSTIHYVNREVGVTAVSGTVFRGGEPVGRQVVRVRAEEIARAPIAPHPSISPDARAALGGRPAVHPPTIARRPVIRANEVRPVAPRPAPGRPAQPGGAARPLIVRHPPSAQNPPFKAREDAMQAHPGRPLEPQQINNIRQGKPAGLPRDPEVGKHPQAPPPKAPGKAPGKPPDKAPPRKP